MRLRYSTSEKAQTLKQETASQAHIALSNKEEVRGVTYAADIPDMVFEFYRLHL